MKRITSFGIRIVLETIHTRIRKESTLHVYIVYRNDDGMFYSGKDGKFVSDKSPVGPKIYMRKGPANGAITHLASIEYDRLQSRLLTDKYGYAYHNNPEWIADGKPYKKYWHNLGDEDKEMYRNQWYSLRRFRLVEDAENPEDS